MLERMFDLVTIGHFTLDLISTSKLAEPVLSLGGPPTYVSLVARKLGVKVSVISKVGEDLPRTYLTWLKKNDVDLSGLREVKGHLTTRFILRYIDGRRVLKLENLAPPIYPADVPDLRSRVIHISPVFNEVSASTIAKIRGLTQFLSLDPQGFVRDVNKYGKVYLKRWNQPEVLGQIDIYKSSLEELRKIAEVRDVKSAMREIQSYGVKIVMVTMGARGSILLFEETFYKVPALKPQISKDSTGAGDAFIGAFLAEYVKGKDVVWCACVGSSAASLIVEEVGQGKFLWSRQEVYERATKIYKGF